MGGGLAQLGEHYVRNVGVGGSTPLPSTKHLPHVLFNSSDSDAVNRDEVPKRGGLSPIKVT